MEMDKETRLKLAILLSLVFMCIEIIGGYLANSIAIFSDAAHLLTDIAGFGIALVATIASKQPATKRLTFGFARAEVFGALASVLSLWAITFFLLYAAFDRAWKWYIGHAEPVDGFLMFVVACFGVVVNLCLGYVFHEDHGGGLHPGHSHEHHHHHPSNHDGSDNGSYQKVDYSDIESPHDHDHSHGHDHPSSKHKIHEDHSHDHGHGRHQSDDFEHVHDDHDHGHGHDHHQTCSGHDHSHSKLIEEKRPTESTPLLGGSRGGDHDHEHDHHPRYDGGNSSSNSHSHDSHDHCDSGHDHDHFGEENHLHEGDVNIQAAYLHVLTDLIQSIGVALAGVIMWQFPHYEIIDPICTLIFSIIALHSTLPLLSRVFLILFEGTPTQIDWETVMDKFSNIPGVDNVHDLHIWNISSTSISLTCHMRATNPQQALLAANQICRKLGIHHTTIQVHDAADDRFCYSQVCDGESKEFAANRAGESSKSSKNETNTGCVKSDKNSKSLPGDTKV